MNRSSFILLKMLCWSGWPLLPAVLAFLITGYSMSGRYGLGALMDEKTAWAIHKMLHLPFLQIQAAFARGHQPGTIAPPQSVPG